LVNDEKKSLDFLSERIRLKNFEPVTAPSGRDGIQMAKRKSVDIAIVDYKIPGMDGIVTITKLKEIRPVIKTVLLTGHGNEKVKQAAEALDAYHFVKDRMSSF
jgi:two-component system response regulator AtoC